MQRKLKREGRSHQHLAKCGFAHLGRVLELHVAADGMNDLVDFFSRETKSFEDLGGHLSADPFMTVEMDAAGQRVSGSGLGLGNVVKEHSPRKHWIRRL